MNQRQIFMAHVAQTTPFPMGLEVERAQGVYIYSPDGRQYIDMISGISVSNIGHCHPAVVAAVSEQAARAMHLMVYGEFIYNPQTALAQELCEWLPDSLDNFYFTNSGTEAVEGALKLAKRATGRYEIISYHHAYHGSTAGALSIMGSDTYQSAFRPLIPNCHRIHYNDFKDLDQITTATAAVVAEVVQAEAGVRVGEQAYLRALRDRCTEVGALLIFDEIQTGMGRTGYNFAFERVGVVPDILLLGKGFGGGMPIAAFIANRELMRTLSFDPILGHISTFAGHPVSCAAALASMQVLKREGIVADVDAKGAYLEAGLTRLGFQKIRRQGLMMAIEHPSQDINFQYCNQALEHGVIVDWFLFDTCSTRLAPPLNISYQEINSALERLSRVKLV